MHIIPLNTEVELRNKNIYEFRETKIFDNSTLYFGDGIKHYYDIVNKYRPSFDIDGYYSLLDKNVLKKNKNKKIAFVSLGCGNSERERLILDRLYTNGHDFTYFGLDSSMGALELSMESMAGVEFPVNLICANFTSDNFTNEFADIIKGHDLCIYAFFGNTIGNEEQDYLADILYNMLNKDDYLWIESLARAGTTEEENGKLFDKYASRLQDDVVKNHFFAPLKELGVSMDDGKMIMHMAEEPSIKALRFKFQFVFTKTVHTSWKDKKIVLTPDTVVELISVRNYDPDNLISFYKIREFDHLDTRVKDGVGQFLFRKQ